MESSEAQPILDNPSLLAVCNAYRRLHGVWPDRARMTPAHFADMAASSSEEGLLRLATVLDIEATTRETSSRVTVFGVGGALTYADRVTDDDWAPEAFTAWLMDSPTT